MGETGLLEGQVPSLPTFPSTGQPQSQSLGSCLLHLSENMLGSLPLLATPFPSVWLSLGSEVSQDPWRSAGPAGKDRGEWGSQGSCPSQPAPPESPAPLTLPVASSSTFPGLGLLPDAGGLTSLAPPRPGLPQPTVGVWSTARMSWLVEEGAASGGWHVWVPLFLCPRGPPAWPEDPRGSVGSGRWAQLSESTLCPSPSCARLWVGQAPPPTLARGASGQCLG